MSAPVFYDETTGFPLAAMHFWLAVEMGQLSDKELRACGDEGLFMCGRGIAPCDLARAEIERRRRLS